MSKIIIHNKSQNPDLRAVDLVRVVMRRGFESGENQYCWVTTFPSLRTEVHAMKTRGNTHTFKVIDAENNNEQN